MIKHNEVFPSGRASLERLFQGYATEFETLIKVAQSSQTGKYFARIANYDSYIESVANNGHAKEITRALKKSGIIYYKENEKCLFDAASIAHIAICCEILTGSSIPFSVLKEENLDYITRKFFDTFNHLETDAGKRALLEFNLHSADAFRTIQILRGLGLFLKNSENINQLSLGAGSAKKDIRSIHLIPEITFGQGNTILFNFKERHAQDVVIVDGDPSRKVEYTQMCKNKDYPILAINNDALETLNILPNILSKNKLKKRNTVIGLRIDHRMIPDVSDFFERLARSITDTADLIVTIGSGFDINDFSKRTIVMCELHEYLKDAGLAPLLIKLHGEGSIEEEWNSPSFSLKEITTFQILYCKLDRNVLGR